MGVYSHVKSTQSTPNFPYFQILVDIWKNVTNLINNEVAFE